MSVWRHNMYCWLHPETRLSQPMSNDLNPGCNSDMQTNIHLAPSRKPCRYRTFPHCHLRYPAAVSHYDARQAAGATETPATKLEAPQSKVEMRARRRTSRRGRGVLVSLFGSWLYGRFDLVVFYAEKSFNSCGILAICFKMLNVFMGSHEIAFHTSLQNIAFLRAHYMAVPYNHPDSLPR